MSKNEPFAPWQCPLCGEKLTGDSTLKCTKGHCFDRAKEGYWHLLPVQSMRTKAPGDSKEMVVARRAFLNAGYYGIFGKAVGELCAEYGQPASPEAALHLLDAGCGEGWPCRKRLRRRCTPSPRACRYSPFPAPSGSGRSPWSCRWNNIPHMGTPARSDQDKVYSRRWHLRVPERSGLPASGSKHLRGQCPPHRLPFPVRRSQIPSGQTFCHLQSGA